MQTAWTAGCFSSGNMSNYWSDWQRMVLYQVSDNYRPRLGGGAVVACGSTATCLSVNGNGNPNSGSGTYRSTIIMAGKKLGAQTRATQTIDQYLDGSINQNAITNLIFETYRPSEPNYSTVNDMVLCLDGKNNCK
jgi:hypothetical protein